MPKGIDVPTLVDISKRVSDVPIFIRIADKIYSDAGAGYKPDQVNLSQKAFAEYNQKTNPTKTNDFFFGDTPK